MAVLNKSVDEILELEAKQNTVRTFVDWMRVTVRAEKLKAAFMKDLNEFYTLSQQTTAGLS